MISSMRPGLLNVPWWQWSLITGVPFGVLMFLFLGSRYPGDWIIGVGVGVGFGAAMGPIIAGQARRLRPVIESMSAEEYDQVRRAAARGPVPAEPRLRQDAARFASHHYEEMTRFRVQLMIVFGLFFVLAALTAVVVSSPWSWLSAGFFALMLAFQVLWPRRLRRRIERLQAEPRG
jgi:Flp pilus assembly protein TadB